MQLFKADLIKRIELYVVTETPEEAYDMIREVRLDKELLRSMSDESNSYVLDDLTPVAQAVIKSIYVVK